MTQLVSVQADLSPWPRSRRALLMDADTGLHYLVVTVTSPWRNGPFSMVFPIGTAGTLESVPGWIEGRPQMVTGGDMDMPEAIRDLTRRIESHTIMTESEGQAKYLDMIDQDTEAFGHYTTRTKPFDTTE